MRALTAALGVFAVGLAAGCPGATTTHTTVVIKPKPFEPKGEIHRMHDVPPFFIPGERMVWEVVAKPDFGKRARSRFANLTIEAEAIMAVGKPGVVDGERVIIVRSRVKTGGIVAAMGASATQEFITHLRMRDSGVVYRLFRADMMGKSEVVESTLRDHGYEQTRRRRGRSYKRFRRLPRGEVGYDIQAILGILRGWNPKPGTYAYFNVLTDRKYTRHTVRFTGKTTIQTRKGRRRVVRIDGMSRRLRYNLSVSKYDKPSPYTLWLSDDGWRRPLRIAIQMKRAKVLFELLSYRR